jgi:hypothetical protein
MAVDPAAPALYAVCPGFDITSVPLFRFPLGADGSLGDGTRVQTLANRADAVFVQGGHLYLAETYPNPIGIARMPLGDPTALQEPWYGAVQVRAMAATASTLFFATNGPTVVSARRTPLAAPDWQSAAPLPDVAHPHIAALAVRGQTLYSATGHGMSDTTSVNRQSLATLAVPTVLASWTDSVNHRQVMPRAIYPGEQVQEWYADPTARAVAAGAFAAPLRPSSGLVPTLASATPLVCTVTGVVVTPLAAGTCTITGEQAGNAAYLSAPMGSVSLELTTPPAPTPQGVAATKARVVGDAITSSVTIPGPGTISQTGAVRAARAGGITVVCATRTTAKRAGTVRLTCRLNRAGLRRRAAAPLSVTLTTVYRPTGGAAQTSTQRVRVPKATRG